MVAVRQGPGVDRTQALGHKGGSDLAESQEGVPEVGMPLKVGMGIAAAVGVAARGSVVVAVLAVLLLAGVLVVLLGCY